MKALSILIMTLFVSATGKAQTGPGQNLSRQQTSMIKIAAVTAQGDLAKLKTELNEGLDSGLTINQIKEVLVHLYAYCGFPRSIRGIQTFMAVLEQRKAKGINDKAGSEASPIKEEGSKYDRGKAVLAELTKKSQDGPKTGYSAFAPEMDVFLKEHLFADIFERDVLTYSERELVTVSVIASIGDAEPMLQSHLNICLNVGLSQNQLQEFVRVIKGVVSQKDAMAAQKVLDAVLISKK